MVVKEEYINGEIRTAEELREVVKRHEQSAGLKANVLVGTKKYVPEEAMQEVLPIIEEAAKAANMKFAAATFIVPGVGATTFNLIFACYLDDDNACQNFLIKQRKYELEKMYILN